MLRKLTLCRLAHWLGQNQTLSLVKLFFPQVISAFLRTSFVGCFEGNIYDFLVL
ncbi:MAG: hypothetical protein ABSG80_08930 [Verrucomicrobiota bacterium]